MRVIAGTARRTLLTTPEGLETRPTTDRTKETLFNILNQNLIDSRFLDLFSGSGGIGIEALSRGAAFAVFVDSFPEAVSCIKKNISATHMQDKSLILQKDVLLAIRELEIKKKPFDFIFMDPPYNKGIEHDVLLALHDSKLVAEDTLIIVEASKETVFDYLNETGFTVTREKVYKTNKHVFIELKR